MVEKWICRLSEAGISPPKKICRPVVRILISSAPDGYANIPIADMASAWLCRIHSQGASLDRRTINLMMSIYARAGEIVKTEAWARFMRDKQIAPNHTTMSALVTASRTAGDERRASAWLEYMEESGFTPGDLDENDNDSGTEEEGSLDQDDVTPAKRRTRGCKGNEVRQAGAVATSSGSLSEMLKNPQAVKPSCSSLPLAQLRPCPLSAIICSYGLPCSADHCACTQAQTKASQSLKDSKDNRVGKYALDLEGRLRLDADVFDVFGTDLHEPLTKLSL
jgi:hypothetical protein